jgi:DNA polymerase-1
MRDLFKPENHGTKEQPQWWVGSVLLEKTDGGQPSMNKDALMELAKRGDKRAGAIVSVRKYEKSRQFLEGHILGFEYKGRVYPNYNQGKSDTGAGTGTGRFSINDPALQQMPKRDEDIAEIVRSCFLPEKGEDWCCADWEQFEFRVFGHYVKDPKIMEAYNNDPKTDYHQIVSNLTGIPRKPRYAGDANSKQINLGLVFGMGQGKLAQEMGLPYTAHVKNNKEYLVPGPEAVAVFEKYHDAIPGVKVLLDKAASIARNRGYVKTIMGRHIRFPNGQFTHKAGGLVFQGTSADCMKLKMVELHPIAKREGFRLLLSVHDELDASMPRKYSKRQSLLMKENLEIFDGVRCPIKLDIPILSSVKLGPNWWEACK